MAVKHKAQGRVVWEILKRIGLSNQEYVQVGHPDTFFRDGVRREIKSYGDRLSVGQRKQLEWMTELGQPWELLQEIRGGPVLRIRHLDTYDLYREYLRTPRYYVNPVGAENIREAYSRGETRAYLSKLHKVSKATIDNIINNKHCSHR